MTRRWRARSSPAVERLAQEHREADRCRSPRLFIFRPRLKSVACRLVSMLTFLIFLIENAVVWWCNINCSGHWRFSGMREWLLTLTKNLIEHQSEVIVTSISCTVGFWFDSWRVDRISWQRLSSIPVPKSWDIRSYWNWNDNFLLRPLQVYSVTI